MKKLLILLCAKKVITFLLIGIMLVQQHRSFAQALPVAPATNFVVNRAIAGIVTRTAINRGFAANDPRIAATLSSVGTQMTAVNTASTVAGIGLAIAGAPVWMTIAGGLGVLALGAAVVASGSNGGMTTLTIDETSLGTKLKVDPPPVTPATYTAPQMAEYVARWQQAVAQGAPIYRSPYNCYSNEACYALPLLPDTAGYRYNADIDAKTVLMTTDVNQYGEWYTFLNAPTFTMPAGVTFIWTFAGTQINVNSAGGSAVTVFIHEERSGSDDPGLPNYSRINTYNHVGTVYGNIGPKWYSNLEQAAAAIPQSVTSALISDQTLAQMANNAWNLAAAQPSYEGIPYSVGNPLTAQDVAAWRSSSSLQQPTVGDLLTPASNPNSSTVPISESVQPATATNTTPTPGMNGSADVNVINTPNVNVVNNVRVDLGDDPGITAPTDGFLNPPEARSILAPLITLLPSLRHFVVPPHASECPKPSFEIFGKTIVMDSHCELTETIKPTIYAIMGFVWTMVAIFIVLSA